MSKPVLYSYFRSSASWRVRIALAYKGIDYEYHAVNLVKDGGEQLKDDYRELNSMKQVPTLIIDGITLNQSLPIIEYLEETRPNNSLLPKDPKKRHQARQLAEIINSGIQPLQNLSTLNLVGAITGDDGKKAEWAKHWIEKGFQAIEKLLTKTSGKFCIGDEVTIADLCLIPQVYGAHRFGVDLSQYPNIKRIAEECRKLDAFIAADFSRQPDTPEELKEA